MSAFKMFAAGHAFAKADNTTRENKNHAAMMYLALLATAFCDNCALQDVLFRGQAPFVLLSSRRSKDTTFAGVGLCPWKQDTPMLA
jgi:hypothetical protein